MGLGRFARHRLVSPWRPVAAWLGLIFVLSSIPTLGSGGSDEFRLDSRSVAHVAIFMVLGFVTLRGFIITRARRPEWWTLVFGLLIAVADEIHQAFVPGRSPSVLDIGMDAVGLCIGMVVWRQIASRVKRLARPRAAGSSAAPS